MSGNLSRRRHFLLSAAGGVAGIALACALPAIAVADVQRELTHPSASPRQMLRLSIRQVQTDLLDIGHQETGPESGLPIIVLHGFPYDIHRYAAVAPMLAAQGYRVIVPHWRGHGTTRFLEKGTARSGQRAAIDQDVIALMDALSIPEAVLACYDWGGRAACVVAAMWPKRCAGLVSVNSYLIQDIAKAGIPAPAKVERSIAAISLKALRVCVPEIHNNFRIMQSSYKNSQFTGHRSSVQMHCQGLPTSLRGADTGRGQRHSCA